MHWQMPINSGRRPVKYCIRGSYLVAILLSKTCSPSRRLRAALVAAAGSLLTTVVQAARFGHCFVCVRCARCARGADEGVRPSNFHPGEKDQGSDEGAPRIPDLRCSARTYCKKRFPHRFLLSSGAFTLMHVAFQSAGIDRHGCGIRATRCQESA